MHSNHRNLPKKNTLISSPLHQAALYGNLEQVLILQKNEKQFKHMLSMPDHNDSLPLDRAAPRGHYHIVKILVDAHENLSCPYNMRNKQEYTPTLSAVRWYCKVLDNTYKNPVVYGKFNTGSNKINEYIAIIKLLIQRFPEQLHQPDTKLLNDLHYVIYHLESALSKNDNKILKDLTQLMTILLESDVTALDQQVGLQMSPRTLAKNKGVLHIIESIEISIKKNQKNSEQPAESKSDIVPEKSDTLIQSSTSSIQAVASISELTPPQENQLEQFIKHKKKPKKKKNRMESDPVHVEPKKELLDVSQLVKDIFMLFQATAQYQPISTVDRLNHQTIECKLHALLSESKDSLTSNNAQERQQLVSKLAQSLQLKSETTGFLCWKRTIRWISIDEIIVQQILLKNKKDSVSIFSSNEVSAKF